MHCRPVLTCFMHAVSIPPSPQNEKRPLGRFFHFVEMSKACFACGIERTEREFSSTDETASPCPDFSERRRGKSRGANYRHL